MRIITALVLAIALATPLSMQDAKAQADYPNRSIKLIVPFAPGGSGDLGGRVFGQALSDRLGQPVTIENRGGAGSILGTEAVVKSAPDGYTFLYNTSNVVLNLSLYDKLSYDPFKDLTPVGLTATGPQILVVSAELPVSNLQQFIDRLKANPGKLSYASSGNGNINHILAVNFLSATGTNAVHVPYKGGSAMYPDLVSGRTHFYFGSITSSLPFVRSGQVKAIAITGTARLKTHPDVPTFAELGHPEMTAGAWQGILAPAGTPKPIIDKVSAAILSAVKDPELISKLEPQGMVPFGSTPEEYAKYLRTENERWGKLIKAAGIKL